MSNINIQNNSKLGSETISSEAVQPSRCPTGEQGRPGRHHATASESGREGGLGYYGAMGKVVGNTGATGRKVKTKKEGRRGKVGERWTDEERRVLRGCFVRSVGKRSGGYI